MNFRSVGNQYFSVESTHWPVSFADSSSGLLADKSGFAQLSRLMPADKSHCTECKGDGDDEIDRTYAGRLVRKSLSLSEDDPEG
jgi:hypothetical protein